jgi:protoporphyrinogen oxidase
MRMAKTVVILGGGPCGLSAAWDLTMQGYHVIVLEQDTKLGGLSSTTEYRGFRFDLGGHRFISPNQQLVDRVCALMQQDFLVQTRKSVIMLGGKQFTYPLSAREVFSTTGLRFGTYAFVDYLLHNAVHHLGRRSDQSFEEWIVNRFGRHLYNTFFGPYTEKLWGLAPQQLSSDWAAQRISLLNLGDAFWRLFGIGKGTPRTYAKRYYYPKRGIGQLFERIGEVVGQQGGCILSPARARRVHVHQDRVTQVEFDYRGRRESLACDALISTLPLPELVRMLTPSVRPEVLAASAELCFRSLRFLNLLVDQPEISGNTWSYVSDKKYLMTRIQEPKQRSPFNAPKDQTSLMLELPCQVGDAVWNAADADLFERCSKDLYELGIDIQPHVIDYFSTRARHAYPIYRRGFKAHRQTLYDVVNRYDNLITCGRQGTFRYIFADTAMEMGFAAARCLQGQSAKADIYDLRVEKSLLEAEAVQ